MRETRLLMGMPITVEIADPASAGLVDEVFGYFAAVDERFSTYKTTSEISALNQGHLTLDEASAEMRQVLDIAQRTKVQSAGYFDIRRPDGALDPSGIVKGWAIRNAADLIAATGARNFYVEAGGDIQTSGRNGEGGEWIVGIRNPFNEREIIKAVKLSGKGIATSGNYARGRHIYDPHRPQSAIANIVSLSVIGPDVLEADRFATAAFAMGLDGIYFIQNLPDLEAYMIDAAGVATFTTGFGAYVTQ